MLNIYEEEILLELKKAYGNEARFRDGQLEAIKGILRNNKQLIVQRTGWGKSLVYFLAAKIMRENGKGIMIIISPLIALMNNQIESARRLDLTVRTINSTNQDDWKEIVSEINNDQVDALIISPERLGCEEFKEEMSAILHTVSLFVVDEAHCISDWGHDFRPDYKRIVDIIQKLPPNIPVLATTATANDRVIKDIKAQLGEELKISRGQLARKNLSIQVNIDCKSKEARLAWLSKNINKLPGTGIIYCLTVRDCKLVEKWLNANEVECRSYYAEIEAEEKERIVQDFMNNHLKVLVATTAFGMGFDKADIGFVIHFQKPANLISYYQQIGRAGRNIDNAYAIILSGEEDQIINNYFIDTAFPTENQMTEVVNQITQANNGIKESVLQQLLNMKKTRIKNCLKHLLVEGIIYKEGSKYYRSARPWNPDLKKSEEITDNRKKELEQMNIFLKQSGCYMQYITKHLDDDSAAACEICSNCSKESVIGINPDDSETTEAEQFLKQDFNRIEPRKRWPAGVKIEGTNKIKEEHQCEIGWVLSNYGDAGWGKVVSYDKYHNHYFCDELVKAAYELLKEIVIQEDIRLVTWVPSLREPELVKSFAERLAEELGLPSQEILKKTQNTKCQKEFNVSSLQFKNAYDSFEVTHAANKNILLIDDMVDSRWTMTVCGYKLRKRKSGKIFPFALANSTGK